MAAANESQGLKIAVAAFVTLSVVLAVMTYFGWSSYSQAAAKEAQARSDAGKAQQAAGEATKNFNYLRDRAGFAKAGEDLASIEAAVKKSDARLNERLAALSNSVKSMAESYRAAGGSADKVNELTAAAEQVVAQIATEPNRTFDSTIDRMTQLVDNMSQLNAALVLDNEALRKGLQDTNQVNASQLAVESDALRKAKEDLAAEHDRHEGERQLLLNKHDELQTRTAEQEARIAELERDLTLQKEEGEKLAGDLNNQLRGLRERVESKEEVMDVPDGRITYVDYQRGEVRTNITRRMGAKPRLQLSVFDRNSPGVPTDRPKGLVELTRVDDSGSVGRIVRTNTPSEPIRYNDHVYSAAWSANRPERFALIGKIDINRDGVDDRADLKRMIQAAGGAIDYDLPPPGRGQESGKISGLTSWYVLDDRTPIRGATNVPKGEGEDSNAFLDRRSKALEQAHRSGVRPIAIERLLAQLGYTHNAATPGQVEALDAKAIQSLTNPSGRPTAAPAPNGTNGDDTRDDDQPQR